MRDVKDGYTYDPKSGCFSIPSSVLARMIYRIGAPKEKIATEDALEAEKVRAQSRGELREKLKVVDLNSGEGTYKP